MKNTKLKLAAASLALLLAGALAFGALFGAVMYGAYDHIQGEPRLMVILGCQVKPWGPSILLQDRLDTALAYLQDHPDMTVVVSGGQGPDEPTSEAQAMADYLTRVGCNVGRGDYQSAYAAAERVLEVRERLARRFGAPDPRNVIFTPGCTYGLNMVLKGLLRPGDKVAASPMEHNAVLRPLRQLEDQGVEILWLPCADTGELLPDRAAERLTADVKLCVLTHASNVCGTRMPIEAVGKLCRERGILFCVDAAQSAGFLPLDMGAMGIDALAMPAHKGLLGPQGLGALLLTDAVAQALGEKRGVRRYASLYLPMDEALVLCAVDLSGRCTLNWDIRCQTEKVGDFDVECAKEFWYGFARSVPATVHFVQFAGENTHHILEACFKGAGHALAEAVRIDAAHRDEIPSTKGLLV